MTGAREIFCHSIAVGHGNPYSVIQAAQGIFQPTDSLHYSFAPITSQIARPIHSVIHRSHRLNHKYAEQSDQVRSTKMGWMIGMLAWIENFATNPAVLAKPTSPRVLLATQELQLLPFTHMPHLLKAMFPDPNRYLLMPDVFPRPSAISILQKLHGLVTPVVLTRSGANTLREAGLKPLWVKSWLLPPDEDESMIKGRPQVVIKTSGGGAKRSLLKSVVQHATHSYPDHRVVVSAPHSLTTIENGHTTLTPGRDLAHLYSPIFNQNTKIIISQASELIALAAALKFQRGEIQHQTFAISGEHEVTNFAWGLAFGVTSRLGGANPLSHSGFLSEELSQTPFNP